MRRKREPEDEVMERLREERRAGELDSAMQSGTDEEPEFAIGERHRGEVSEEEARRALSPEPRES